MSISPLVARGLLGKTVDAIGQGGVYACVKLEKVNQSSIIVSKDSVIQPIVLHLSELRVLEETTF